MRALRVRYCKRRGSILIIAALALFVLLGCAALTIDYSMFVLSRQQLQDATDAACLAGAGALLNSGLNFTTARQTVMDYGLLNKVYGQPLHIADADIQAGAWMASTKTIVAWSPAYTQAAIRVTGRRTTGSTDGPIPFLFAKALGIQSRDLTATATAGVLVLSHPRRPTEITVVQDASGSFAQEWSNSITAGFEMYNLINSVSITGDKLGFVTFDEVLTNSTSYDWVWDGYRYVKVYKPLNKIMTTFGTSRTTLPSDWTTFKSLLNSHNPAGYTRPSLAFNWANTEYDSHGDAVNHQQSIVLISDGMPFGSTTTKTNQYRAETVTAVNALAAQGVRIYTVTLTAEADGAVYGNGGADYQFNESLVRNGGVAFRTASGATLRDALIAVGTLEVGAPSLIQ
ncbi:MAG: pilus assembly protein TadG-related protein [Armatimonadota bacterium]